MKSLTQNWVKKDLNLYIYVPSVIKMSKYLRTAIYFSDRFGNITKSSCLSIPYLLVVTLLNGDKRIKITIYINFEANILLTSKNRFHKF